MVRKILHTFLYFNTTLMSSRWQRINILVVVIHSVFLTMICLMFSRAVSLVVESLLHSPSHLTSFSPSAMTTVEFFLCRLQLTFSMPPKALYIFKTRNIRMESENQNRHEKTRLGDIWNQKRLLSYKTELVLSFYPEGQSSGQRLEKKLASWAQSFCYFNTSKLVWVFVFSFCLQSHYQHC